LGFSIVLRVRVSPDMISEAKTEPKEGRKGHVRLDQVASEQSAQVGASLILKEGEDVCAYSRNRLSLAHYQEMADSSSLLYETNLGTRNFLFRTSRTWRCSPSLRLGSVPVQDLLRLAHFSSPLLTLITIFW